MTTLESPGADAWFRLERDRLEVGGAWTIGASAKLDRDLRGLNAEGPGPLTIDASQIEKLDSSGAWLLLRTRRLLEEAGRQVEGPDLPDSYRPLLENLEKTKPVPAVKPPRPKTFLRRLYIIGKGTMGTMEQGYKILGYVGRVTVETGEALAKPKTNLRVAAIITQIEQTGLNAMPIVGLLSFLIGVVLAYQGVDQLAAFGAEVFTINILGVGLLRELGGLITAIIVAGRSGSAFTAQIGTMRVNQEIDAMQTMGLNTIDTLVLPRVIGLVIVMPLLTFYACVMGLIGGAVMCYFDLGITVPVFIRQLDQAVSVSTLLVGIIKAPVFAIVIAMVGCYEGFQVERNAASVGALTTRAVVEAIFLVIVIDAAFSVLFSVIGI
jgi:phospholipid/cholesterol/gamma-HCH transport system permease protein